MRGEQGFSRLVHDLVGGLQGEGFVVSSQSEIVTSSMRVGHAGQSTAAALGVHISVVSDALTLGLDVTSRGVRAQRRAAERAAKAYRRSSRLARLRAPKYRRMVAKGAITPSVLYQGQALGTSWTSLLKLRSEVTAHFGARAGWCATTFLRLVDRRDAPLRGPPPTL